MQKCIFTARNQIEAELIKSMLKENDIECFLQNYNFAGLYPTGTPIGEINVMVKEEDSEKAAEIVKELNQYE